MDFFWLFINVIVRRGMNGNMISRGIFKFKEFLNCDINWCFIMLNINNEVGMKFVFINFCC